MFGIDQFRLEFLTSYPYLTALFLILFILFTFWIYRRTNPPLSRLWKTILGGLRIVALFALFAALLEPVINYQRSFERKPNLSILIDKSKSMNFADNGSTRTETVNQIIESDQFRDFLNKFEYKRYLFSDKISDNADILNTDRTSIGEILSELSEKEIGQPAEAWILFSDGISNYGILAEAVAGQIKSPLFSVGIGDDAEEKDAVLSDVESNRVVYAGKATTIKAKVEWRGMKGEQTALEIRSGNQTLASKQIKFAVGDLQNEFEIKFTPQKIGQQTFQLMIKPIDDEISDNNNHRSFSMTVLKSKLEILLLSDRLDWEFAFLKRFLDNSESVNLTPVVFDKDGSYMTGSLPNSQAGMNKYDLIILYDIDLNRVKSRDGYFNSYLAEKGGGMLVFLGENYLKDKYPRWIDDYLPFSNKGAARRVLNFKYNGQPSEDYLFHPAIRLSDSRQSIRDDWSSLPYFESLVPIDSIDPKSEIMATVNLGESGANQPIIGLKRIGQGRVLAVAAMPFWHWAFFGYGFDQDDAEYRFFFDGLINWLSVKEDSDPIQIIPDKNIYTRGETVGFTAYVYDLGFRPILGSTGSIKLKSANGQDSIMAQIIEQGEGKYRAEFETVPSGRFNYSGIIEKEGKRLKESDGTISIESYTMEEFIRRPQFDRLRNISGITGGQFFQINQIDSLYRSISTKKLRTVINSEIIVWNKIWLLLIFIAALGVEWFIRKRLQLI